MNIKKKYCLKGLFMLLVVSMGAGPLWGQKESESIEKYRVVYEYKAPVFENSGNEDTPVALRPSIPPDSMGVYYYYDNDLARLLDLHKYGNESMTEAPGFRIQIYAGSKMETANEAKADFLQTFRNQNMEVYKDWNPPHFWVRVGDFLSRNDAMKQLSNVRMVFPDAFVVQDKIKLPKYKRTMPQN
jgi:hypothetical protein